MLWKTIVLGLLTAAVIVGMAAAFLWMTTPHAHAHDTKALADLAKGDPRRSDWFESLKQPDNGISCCNLSDCHETEARQLPDLSWEAIIPEESRWVKIPPGKVVKRPLSIDGAAYICNSKSPPVIIYCFIEPIPGF